jgi:molybdopterin/thiamine biosynthesis adenylyltransferase
LSDLNREILFGGKDLGHKKSKVAFEKWSVLNSNLFIESICEEITHENPLKLMKEFQIVIGGTDNFETRLVLNEACVDRGGPLYIRRHIWA